MKMKAVGCLRHHLHSISIYSWQGCALSVCISICSCFLHPNKRILKVPVAPYIVNYNGALFRQYPGPWQVMLKQSDNSYACVAESPTRFNPGETKEELLWVLGLKEEEGYKTTTWWEEDVEAELSTAWRS